MNQVTHLYNSKFLNFPRAPSADLVLGALTPSFSPSGQKPKNFLYLL
nr:MAG TPA: hypothetical protein [Caudoviricetes sp.]